MVSVKKNRAVYPGTFDPVTNGHISLIERACHLFEDVIVAVARNTSKEPLFNFEERIEMVEKSISNKPYSSQVRVIGFNGLLAELSREMKASAIVRGLRAISDFEYEFQMALMNRKLAKEIETVFLMPSLKWVYLTSTIVKDVASHGGDIGTLVPGCVKTALRKQFATAVG